jgi:hypothetical protein
MAIAHGRGMTTASLVLLIVTLGVIIAIALAAPRRLRRRREALRQRFGPEYERTVEELGSVSRAERELAGRAKRVRQLPLRELSETDRARFRETWTEVQARFVDEPALAVQEANELIKKLMAAHGYPQEDFDHRVADLSVDHADVVQHYRAARTLVVSAGCEGQNGTEDLRQALVHYRALVSELLGGPANVEGRPLQARHA